MTTDNTVSVVMCTFNGERYLRQQLDSILAQTYPVSEIIVQDDCSTDGTVALIMDYAARHPIIKLHRNTRNLGFNENFKTCLARATGSLVAISDDDDVWYPQKIARQVQAIGSCDICCSGYDIGPTRQQSRHMEWNIAPLRMLFDGVAGHTMLIRRDFLERKNVWIPGMAYDWNLSVTATLLGSITQVPESLNWHRRHSHAAGAMLESAMQVPAWRPYATGLAQYRRMQHLELWKRLYTFIFNHSQAPGQQGLHTMSRLMLSHNPLRLAQLCALCCIHRQQVYPDPAKCQGLEGMVRGLFYPFIYAYHNHLKFVRPQ